MSDFFGKVETVKARKPHQCATCRRRIDPGEHYTSQFVVYYDVAQRFKQCSHCLAVWKIWCPEDGDGNISEDGYDCWASDAEARDVAELRAMVHFRQQWRRKDGTFHPLPVPTKAAA